MKFEKSSKVHWMFLSYLVFGYKTVLDYSTSTTVVLINCFVIYKDKNGPGCGVLKKLRKNYNLKFNKLLETIFYLHFRSERKK